MQHVSHRAKNKQRRRVCPLTSTHEQSFHMLPKTWTEERCWCWERVDLWDAAVATRAEQRCEPNNCIVIVVWSHYCAVIAAYSSQFAFDLSVISAVGERHLFTPRSMIERNFTFSLWPSPPPPLELAFDLAAGDRCHSAQILENLFCLRFLELLCFGAPAVSAYSASHSNNNR